MDYFNEAQQKHITSGVSTFFQMIGLFADPVHGRFIAEEQDLVSALNTLKRVVEDSQRLLGKQKYQGVDFDVKRAMIEDMRTYLLNSDDELERAYLHKRHNPMFYLVIEPVIEGLSHYPHEELIDIATYAIDQVIDVVNNCTDYGTKDQAVEANLLVRQLINTREAERKQQREAMRKPRRNKRASLIQLLMGVDLNEIDTFED